MGGLAYCSTKMDRFSSQVPPQTAHLCQGANVHASLLLGAGRLWTHLTCRRRDSAAPAVWVRPAADTLLNTPGLMAEMLRHDT